MKLNIKIYLDYISPFSFLTTFIINEFENNESINIEYIPIETPKLDLNHDHFRKSFWNNILCNMPLKLGYKLEIPDVNKIESELVCEAYYYARDNGKGIEFNNKIYELLFKEGKNIGQLQVLNECCKEIGLNIDGLKDSLENRTYRQIREKGLQKSVDDNVVAIPTIIIGDTRVVGYKKKEYYAAIIDSELEKLHI